MGREENKREAILNAWDAAGVDRDAHPELLASVFELIKFSDFCADIAIEFPRFVINCGLPLIAKQAIPEDLSLDSSIDFDLLESEDEVMKRLRRYRRKHSFIIAWRDLMFAESLQSTLLNTSVLASHCINIAIRYCAVQLHRIHGIPRDSQFNRIDLAVLGLGKLGGTELNFSSDIDLIFAYKESGVTDGERPLSHASFFRKLCQKVIHVLNHPTEDGLVYRVDTRLRPHGSMGQIVLSYAAMEDYYQREGRDWERYALIKARPVAGCIESAAELIDRLRPFIYRRYIDYSSYAAIRDMKRKIATRLQNQEHNFHIKLGSGGIREIEFIVQSFQLIRGGKLPQLRNPNCLQSLDVLNQLKLIDDDDWQHMSRAYQFYRRAENRLQMLADLQEHSVPSDEHRKMMLAKSMGFEQFEAFNQKLSEYRQKIHSLFDSVFSQQLFNQSTVLRRGGINPADIERWVHRHSFEDPSAAVYLIKQLLSGPKFRSLPKRGKERIEFLLPLVVNLLGEVQQRDACLRRMIRLITQIATRSAYLALLIENPDLLRGLVEVCERSDWIALKLTENPALLDEFLDTRVSLELPSAASMAADLDAQLSSCNADREQELITLKYFQTSWRIKVARSQLSAASVASLHTRYLSQIAESVLAAIVKLLSSDAQQRGWINAERSPYIPGLAIIAYGKCGSREMSYDSDLDLVFVHSDDGDDASVYVRLAQRMIRMLNAMTPAGRLYEVDVRLRPNGKSGLLVTSLAAFRQYQAEKAWTWEHQAIIKARWVCGDPLLKKPFDCIRSDIITLQRQREDVQLDIRNMREKMRASQPTGVFDIKQCCGGLVDIEFICQFFVLVNAQVCRPLSQDHDVHSNLRSLVKFGYLSADMGQQLGNAYDVYRDLQMRQILGFSEINPQSQALLARLQSIQLIWQQIMIA